MLAPYPRIADRQMSFWRCFTLWSGGCAIEVDDVGLGIEVGGALEVGATFRRFNLGLAELPYCPSRFRKDPKCILRNAHI